MAIPLKRLKSEVKLLNITDRNSCQACQRATLAVTLDDPERSLQYTEIFPGVISCKR